MSTNNTPLDYASLDSLLKQQAVALTAAEMHGLLCGIICGGNQDASWLTLVHELTNEGIAFPAVLNDPLQHLCQAIRDTLDDDDFMFQLLMPHGPDVTVFDRADALAGWVNHFLLGLGMMQPKLAQVKDDVGEVIDDLRSIAQLGYEEDEDQEELESSLEEVLEYVRVAALLCHAEFTHQQMPAAGVNNPTLH